ncbi:MAG: dephospho-CoA kinase [Gammaproteobacteria bacterium]|nr:dephospho-CoA kinase [Gammaproteobacteria bacterium]
MFIVGLTGGIGSGKSTVARFFAEMGVPVIDADIIAREVVEPGQAALDEIITAFGPEMLDPDGRLDRTRLRREVFATPAKRQVLEAILHPRIRAEMEKRAADLNAPYCIFVIPLLVETGQRSHLDRVLVVDTRPEQQRQRVRERDALSDAEIDAILAVQTSRKDRLAVADDVITNNNDLNHLKTQVFDLNLRYIALAGQKKD